MPYLYARQQLHIDKTVNVSRPKMDKIAVNSPQKTQNSRRIRGRNHSNKYVSK